MVTSAYNSTNNTMSQHAENTPEYLSDCIKEYEEAREAQEYPTYSGGSWCMARKYVDKYYNFVPTAAQKKEIIKMLIGNGYPHEEYEAELDGAAIREKQEISRKF